MILYHIEEGYNQILILYGYDIIKILLKIREKLLSGCLYRSTVGNSIYAGKGNYFACFKGSLPSSSYGEE